MLLSDAIVSSQQFLFKITVTAETGCSNLAAGMVLAVVPVHIGCSAVVICMQELMRQGMIDLLLTQEMVVAKYHLHSGLTGFIVMYEGKCAACVQDLHVCTFMASKTHFQAYPIRRPEPTTSLGITILHLEEPFVHPTSSLQLIASS